MDYHLNQGGKGKYIQALFSWCRKSTNTPRTNMVDLGFVSVDKGNTLLYHPLSYLVIHIFLYSYDLLSYSCMKRFISYQTARSVILKLRYLIGLFYSASCENSISLAIR